MDGDTRETAKRKQNRERGGNKNKVGKKKKNQKTRSSSIQTYVTNAGNCFDATQSARDAEEPARGEAPQRIIVHDARPRSQIMPGVMGPRDCSCYVTLRPKLVLCANRPHSRKSARRAATRELGREPHRVSDARSSERARPLQMLWGWANGGKHPMSAAVSVQSGHVHVHVCACGD